MSKNCINCNLIVFLTLMFWGISSFSQEIIFSDAIFLDMKKIHPIHRDKHALSVINKIIKFRGKVISLDQRERYQRQFRIIAVDQSSVKNKITIKYNIFLDQKDTWSQFIIDQNYDFTGQVTAFTPLNTARDSYIFDMVFSSSELTSE